MSSTPIFSRQLHVASSRRLAVDTLTTDDPAFSLEAPEVLDNHEQDLLSHEAVVRDSHARCNRLGVDPDWTRIRQRLSPAAFHAMMRSHAGLAAYSRILFADLHQSILTQNTVFVLTAASGHIICLYSSPEMRERTALHCGMGPGVSLTEESCGTTAVAISLRQHTPAALRAEQHYCSLFRQCYSVAAPIDGRDGTSSACVAIFSHAEGRLGEKIALARCISRELSRFCLDSSARSLDEILYTPPTAPPGDQTPSVTVKLTVRQKRVLELFAQGLSYKQIARELGVASTKTIEEHLDAVRGKLGVANRRQCIQHATELGLLDPQNNS